MKKILRFFRNWDRRTLLITGSVVLVVVLITLLIVFKPFSSGKKHIAPEAIPDNAFVVFRINNPGDLLVNNNYKNATNNVAMLPAVSHFLLGLRQTDTVLSVSEKHQKLLSSSRLYISLHPTGKNKTETLFVLELPDESDAEDIYDDLVSTGKVTFTEKTVDGNTCYTIGKKAFILYPSKNLIIGSASERLLSLSISALQKKSGLSQNEDFLNAHKTAASDCAINVLVSTPLLYRSLGQMISGNAYVNLAFLQTFSNWGNMDVKVQNDALVFSGLFPMKNDGSSIMTLFDEPGERATAHAFSMLPANTSAAFSFGFGSFEKFFSAYAKRLLNEKQNVYDNQEELAHLNNEAETESLESCFYKHINGLLSVFSVTTAAGREPEIYCAFPIDDAESVNDCLRDYSETNDWDTSNFRGATLYEIPVEYGAYSLFGPLFEPIAETCIAVSDSFVYIGNSIEQLKPVLNDVLSGRTLGSSRYKQTLTNHLSSSWNTFVYLNTASALYYLQNRWLSDTTLISSLTHSRAKEQSGIISLTCARQSDGIVLSGTWFFATADSSSSQSWATTLDAEVAGQPVILKDFKTGEFWIATADVYNNIYLLNSNGAIEWKKDIGDAVNSDFQLLWSGNKEKRSLAFSTTKAIYIIGLNGEMRKSFPVTIRGGLSSNLIAADYDNNQNYRLLFCDNNGVFYNYSTDAKPTEGWLKPDMKQHSDCRVFFSPLEGKDYLVVAFPDNTAIVYDRKGNKVVALDDIQFNKGLNPLVGGRETKFWTAFSTDGALISINHEGKINSLTTKSYGENVIFSVSGQQVILVSEGTMSVLDQTGSEKMSDELSESAIDFIKTVVCGDQILLLYRTSENIVGVRSVTSAYSESNLKNDASAFDCLINKNKMILVTSSGKNIVSETIAVPAD